MSKNKIIRQNYEWIRILFLFVFIVLIRTQTTSSYFSSVETSPNTMASGIFPTPTLSQILGLRTAKLNIETDDPSLDFYLSEDKHSVGFTLSGTNLTEYTKASYLITYDSENGLQGITGAITIDESIEIKDDLTLGTCTTETCTYHEGVSEIKIVVTLTNLVDSVTLTKTISL